MPLRYDRFGSILPSIGMSEALTPAPPRKGSERLHLSHVEGLRALAALMVYVNHAYAQTWYPPAGEYASGVLSVFAYSLIAGHLSVSVFIVISGSASGCRWLPPAGGSNAGPENSSSGARAGYCRLTLGRSSCRWG